MIPRLSICSQCLRAVMRAEARLVCTRDVRHASTQAIVPPPTSAQIEDVIHPILRFPPSQPPSHRHPEIRRSQLHRQYTSLLRSTPMMLIFQHTNLSGTEWMALRRELAGALSTVDKQQAGAGSPDSDLADRIRIQIIRPRVFSAALKVVELWNPEHQAAELHPTDPRSHTSLPVSLDTVSPTGTMFTHALSREAYEAVKHKTLESGLEHLLTGPTAIVTFPSLSTEHLKASLSILCPKAPQFPAPTRRANPGYHDPLVQLAVRKLLLLGARVEGKTFDIEGTRWVGSIQGGINGLRGQLVAILQGVGVGLTNSLETASRSVYFTMEGRKEMLEKESGSKAPEG